MKNFIETLEQRIDAYIELRDREGAKSDLFLMYVNRVEILGEVLKLAKLINEQ